MLEIEAIDTWRGPAQILRKVSLTVGSRESVCLVGRNGAGKTTTIDSIIGLLPVGAGKIVFQGRDIGRLPPHRRARLGIGYAPEDAGLFTDLTVAENFQVCRWMAESSGREGQASEEETERRIFAVFPEVRQFTQRRCLHLSGGEKKMVAVARAMALSPSILLLDEPFEGLAPVVVTRFVDAVKKIKAMGISILIAESHLANATRVADRLYAIDRGEIIYQGGPQEVLQNEDVMKTESADSRGRPVLMKRVVTQRFLLGLASLATMLLAYTLVSNAGRLVGPEALPRLLRPEALPPTQAIVGALAELVAGGRRQAPAEGHVHPGMPEHSSDHVGTLLQQGVTLQRSLAVSAARVLFGLAVGVPLGILAGALMGWSRRADDYLHPIYALVRSVPPLALITYVMLWLGHGEAHRLIPVVYAVAATMVIPAYHGMGDVVSTYVVAARSLGARGRLLLTRVLFPAASPTLLAGLRYAVAIAWMTTVGAEMLMAENGMGNLIVGGGLWASRLQTKADPAVVMVGILAVAVAGWAMDALVRALAARLTRWVR